MLMYAGVIIKRRARSPLWHRVFTHAHARRRDQRT